MSSLEPSLCLCVCLQCAYVDSIHYSCVRVRRFVSGNVCLRVCVCLCVCHFRVLTVRFYSTFGTPGVKENCFFLKEIPGAH